METKKYDKVATCMPDSGSKTCIIEYDIIKANNNIKIHKSNLDENGSQIHIRNTCNIRNND